MGTPDGQSVITGIIGAFDGAAHTSAAERTFVGAAHSSGINSALCPQELFNNGIRLVPAASPTLFALLCCRMAAHRLQSLSWFKRWLRKGLSYAGAMERILCSLCLFKF